jgi:hypothetical protein
MSTWFETEVTCPACGARIAARLASGVHVARAPEIRAQVLARTFHRVTCGSCAHAFTAARPLVYTDIDRKHWVQIAPPNERPRWPEYEDATARLFERAMTGSPYTDELREGFLVRVVFGLEELREKLVVWDANLDDAVVECVKVHAIAQRPELARAKSLIVDAVRGGALELVADGVERLAVSRDVVAQFSGDDRLPSRFPELFGGRFVSVHRLLGPRYRWAE